MTKTASITIIIAVLIFGAITTKGIGAALALAAITALVLAIGHAILTRHE